MADPIYTIDGAMVINIEGTCDEVPNSLDVIVDTVSLHPNRTSRPSSPYAGQSITHHTGSNTSDIASGTSQERSLVL